jgi:type III secretion protein Q
MDRHAFAPSLRDHLPAYTAPLAALSRIVSPQIRALPAGQGMPMLRPGHVTLTTNLGEVRIRMDLAGHPALESIALEPDPARRVGLANLYLRALLDLLLRHGSAYGIDALMVGDIVPLDDRLVVTPGLGIVCGLPSIESVLSPHADGAARNVADDPASLQDARFHCVVEVLSPALVAAFAAPHAAEMPPATVLLAGLDGIPIQTRLRLSARRYKRATLETLQHGDILLGWPWQHHDAMSAAEEDDVPDDGRHIAAHWLWGNAGYVQGRHPVRIDGNCIHITGMPDMTDDRNDLPHPDAGTATLDFATPGADSDAHRHDPDGTAQADGVHDTHDADDAIPPDTSILDGIDMMVHVEIACIAMPAAELARVRPGTILTLPQKIADATVNLVVSGRTVATGDLVVVGDQLGVRVHRNGHAHG